MSCVLPLKVGKDMEVDTAATESDEVVEGGALQHADEIKVVEPAALNEAPDATCDLLKAWCS